MSQPTLDALLRRLERLERQNRRLKFVGSAAVFLMGMVLLSGATGAKVPDEIRAKSFVLVDNGGTRRVVMDVVRLPFFDIGGIRLFDARGRARASFAVASDGASGVTLYSEGQTTQAVLSADPDGTPHLQLFDKNGKVLWQAP